MIAESARSPLWIRLKSIWPESVQRCVDDGSRRYASEFQTSGLTSLATNSTDALAHETREMRELKPFASPGRNGLRMRRISTTTRGHAIARTSAVTSAKLAATIDACS